MAEVGTKQKIVLQFAGWAARDADGKLKFPLVLANTDENEEPIGMYSGLKINGSAVLKKDQVLDILKNVAKPDDEKAWPLFALAIED